MTWLWTVIIVRFHPCQLPFSDVIRDAIKTRFHPCQLFSVNFVTFAWDAIIVKFFAICLIRINFVTSSSTTDFTFVNFDVYVILSRTATNFSECYICDIITNRYVDGLVQERRNSSAFGLVQKRRNSSALAMELRLSCTNPSESTYISPFPTSPMCHIWDISQAVIISIETLGEPRQLFHVNLLHMVMYFNIPHGKFDDSVNCAKIWLCHGTETFSALLAVCEENHPMPLTKGL